MICPGVEGENLAARALAALRERGWDAPAAADRDREADPGRRRPRRRQRRRRRRPPPRHRRERVRSNPRIASKVRTRRGSVADLPAIAAELGADVPSQLRPALALVRGAGERVEPLPAPAEHAALLLPGGGGLSTKDVFDEADRLGLGREEAELDGDRRRLRAAAGAGASPLAYVDLLVNDLEPAARLPPSRHRRRPRRPPRDRRARRLPQRLRPDGGRPLRRPRRSRARRRGARPRRRDRLPAARDA